MTESNNELDAADHTDVFGVSNLFLSFIFVGKGEKPPQGIQTHPVCTVDAELGKGT